MSRAPAGRSVTTKARLVKRSPNLAVQFRDDYETLGVARDASEAEIKKAFRKRAHLFHPDVAKDKSTAEAALPAVIASLAIGLAATLWQARLRKTLPF